MSTMQKGSPTRHCTECECHTQWHHWQVGYIQCTNNGCQWQGTLENHTQHSNTCGKLPVNCQNRGCSEVRPRDEMPQHVSQCPKQDVACKDCGKSVTRDSMREHINSLCSHKRIPCPLSCGTNLPRYVFHSIIYFLLKFCLFVCLFVSVALSLTKERHFGLFAFWHVLKILLAILYTPLIAFHKTYCLKRQKKKKKKKKKKKNDGN